jgi:hypothetical protein
MDLDADAACAAMPLREAKQQRDRSAAVLAEFRTVVLGASGQHARRLIEARVG